MEARKPLLAAGILFALASLTGQATLVHALDPIEAPARSTSSIEDPVLDDEELRFLELINEYRAQNGLEKLQVSIKLTRAARWMSEDMAAKNYFSHTDSRGYSPMHRTALEGYTDNPQAENLAAGRASAQDAFEQWRTSPGHNKNMLHPGIKVIGIARAYNAKSTYQWYWTTNFGGWAYANDVLK